MNTSSHRLNCLLLVGLACLAAASYAQSPNPPGTPSSQNASAATTSTTDTAAAERNQVFNDLNARIRRFYRKQKLYTLSEESYYERLHLFFLSFSYLEFQKNPGIFAGDLPEHSTFAYDEFMEASEAALHGVNVYLADYCQPTDLEYADLLVVKRRAEAAVEIPFPGTASRMDDATQALNSEQYARAAATANARIAALATAAVQHTGGSLISTGRDILSHLRGPQTPMNGLSPATENH